MSSSPPEPRRPWLHVIAGCMSSGKTAEVVRLLTRAEIAGRRVLLLTPATDTRHTAGEIVSRTGTRFPCVVVQDAAGVLAEVERRDPDVVGVEEAQFFDEGIAGALERVIAGPRTAIVSGLDQDFAGRPFGAMPELLARADEVTKLTAICVVCGAEATRTQRLRGGAPARANDALIVIGGIGDDTYEARCRACHDVPGAEPPQPTGRSGA
jgi:thymidine kinase